MGSSKRSSEHRARSRSRSRSPSRSGASDSGGSSDASSSGGVRARRRSGGEARKSRHKKSHKKDKKRKDDRKRSSSSKRHRRRHRRSDSEDSGSSSDDDGDYDDADRKRSRKKAKKSKKAKKARRSERSGGDSASDSGGSSSDDNRDSGDLRDNLVRARRLVDRLLREFPELRADLVSLLQMLHGGGVAVIGGIENRRIRSKLKELFPLLRLTKLPEPRGAYAQRDSKRLEDGATLLESLLRELEKPSGDAQPARESPAAAAAAPPSPPKSPAVAEPAPAKRSAPIGPAMPPGGVPVCADDNNDDEDDDDVVGPALPGMRGFRVADARVEAEMAQRARELEQAEWDRARGVAPSASAAERKPLARQEWMTVMPESSFFKDSLAPANRPPGKPAAFRAKEPAAVDHTWFDAPEERERARRAKLDMELLGYVREENAPSAAAAAAAASRTASSGASSAHESIVPAANPEADERMRRQMERLRESRGPSLLEQHQQRLADEAKRGGGAAAKSKGKAGWDRDRDLNARRSMSNDEASRIIEASRGINSKFTAPTISRQFL